MASTSKRKKKVDLTLAKQFFRHWSIDRLVYSTRNRDLPDDDPMYGEPTITHEEALDYLTQQEVIDFLDGESAKLATLYNRIPKHMSLVMLLDKIDNTRGATDAAQVIQGFNNWFKEAPPPSERSFAEKLMQELTEEPSEKLKDNL